MYKTIDFLLGIEPADRVATPRVFVAAAVTPSAFSGSGAL
jgi:hypothetical protein